jgi:hypothetical protein
MSNLNFEFEEIELEKKYRWFRYSGKRSVLLIL